VLAGAAPTAARRPITLRFPRFTVPPNQDREVCTFVRVPMRAAFDVAGQVVVSATVAAKGSTSHHFLLYAYTGKDLEGFRPWEGQIVDSKACLDVGPADATSRVLIAGAQTPRSKGRLRRGLALRLEPTATADGARAVGFLLDSHWINSSAGPVTGAVKVKLLPARPGSVKRYAKPIFEVVGNAFIDVPPHATSEAGWWWGPGQANLGGGIGGADVPSGPACVVSVTGHMHQWGTRFLATYVDASGGRQALYENFDYDHPGQRLFARPLLVRPGERIEYRCEYENGIQRPQRLGCEEEPGVIPGRSILATLGAGDGLTSGAAKPCFRPGDASAECQATDPAYPGRRFTGRCVEARLVFGFTSRDEMCILPGTYYDADPHAAPGHECDL